MIFTRRKFIQSLALVCTAPVINKVNSLVTVNADACLENIPIGYTTGDFTGPGSWYTFLEENLSPFIQNVIFDKKPNPFPSNIK